MPSTAHAQAKASKSSEEETLSTAPFDPRFPNANQTKYCYVSYLDLHKCRKLRGENYEPCNFFAKVVADICPNAWAEKWDEQRENGNFAGDL